MDIIDLAENRIDPALFFETNYKTHGMAVLLKTAFERFVKLLQEYQERDPKYDLLKSILTESHIQEPWINRGCILFSQYFDTIKWYCDRFAKDYPGNTFGLYAGSDKSGIYENGIYHRKSKEDIKKMVRVREIKLLFGTDAASECLNLQTLGTLINLDLPWNPTRLEQRKGRIQRIGQERKEVWIYNVSIKIHHQANLVMVLWKTIPRSPGYG
ncbi:MAG: SWF/SNF helicase family protein [Candidatus Scalindua sp.]|nr:SWF/SNF helicase family protein [Candidatus Scalindua sp.]